MWRYLLPGVVFTVLVGFLYVGLHRNPSALPSPLIGKAAPIFTLTTVENPTQTVSINDYLGHMFVLNVWGTWCGGCRQEHAVLLAIAAQKRVPIVGLNWKDDLVQAQRWLQQLGNPYVATAYDPEGRAGIDWGVYGAPETFLVDAQGTVIYKHIAPMTLEVWNREFVPRLHTGEQ